MDSKWSTSQRSILSQAVPLAGFVTLGVWSYWPTLSDMARTWSKDPQYSHGYLVPLFAAALLWRRRDRLAAVSPRTSWWGLLFLAGGACLRLVGMGLYFEWLEGISFLP